MNDKIVLSDSDLDMSLSMDEDVLKDVQNLKTSSSKRPSTAGTQCLLYLHMTYILKLYSDQLVLKLAFKRQKYVNSK